jgi:hypothetical protein
LLQLSNRCVMVRIHTYVYQCVNDQVEIMLKSVFISLSFAHDMTIDDSNKKIRDNMIDRILQTIVYIRKQCFI